MWLSRRAGQGRAGLRIPGSWAGASSLPASLLHGLCPAPSEGRASQVCATGHDWVSPGEEPSQRGSGLDTVSRGPIQPGRARDLGQRKGNSAQGPRSGSGCGSLWLMIPGRRFSHAGDRPWQRRGTRMGRHQGRVHGYSESRPLRTHTGGRVRGLEAGAPWQTHHTASTPVLPSRPQWPSGHPLPLRPPEGASTRLPGRRRTS